MKNTKGVPHEETVSVGGVPEHQPPARTRLECLPGVLGVSPNNESNRTVQTHGTITLVSYTGQLDESRKSLRWVP